jgi:hypothetical protein
MVFLPQNQHECNYDLWYLTCFNIGSFECSHHFISCACRTVETCATSVCSFRSAVRSYQTVGTCANIASPLRGAVRSCWTGSTRS